jgi:hypothetical protein
MAYAGCVQSGAVSGYGERTTCRSIGALNARSPENCFHLLTRFIENRAMYRKRQRVAYYLVTCPARQSFGSRIPVGNDSMQIDRNCGQWA